MRNRLLEAFKELRKEGFLARANFSSSEYDLICRAEKLHEQGKEVKGLVLWYREDEEHLKRTGKLYITYGPVWTEKYGTIGLDTKSVGKILCEKLTKHNIPYEWNGDPNVRILVG